MSNINTEGLPPEMQQRIAQIIEGAKQNAKKAAPAPAAQAQPAPVPAGGQLAPKVPNLMDHTIALRQEVAALRQELHAVAQVTDAVGQAVGQLYSMFQSQTEPTISSADYQEALQAHQQTQMNEDY